MCAKTQRIVFALGVFVVAGVILSYGTQALAQRAEVDIPLPVSKIEALELNVPIDLENGARVFAGCVGCHDTGPAASNGVGPILDGIIGREAGSLEGYDYSAALQRAGNRGLVWTDYKLDAFLLGPSEFINGNKMAFVGIEDDAARRDLIGYLKTLR